MCMANSMIKKKVKGMRPSEGKGSQLFALNAAQEKGKKNLGYLTEARRILMRVGLDCGTY